MTTTNDVPHLLHDSETDEIIGAATAAQVAEYHHGAAYEGISVDGRDVYAAPNGATCSACDDAARLQGHA